MNPIEIAVVVAVTLAVAYVAFKALNKKAANAALAGAEVNAGKALATGAADVVKAVDADAPKAVAAVVADVTKA